MPENDYSFLDKVRINEGNEKCKTVFREVCNRDKRRAVFLINDSRLTFPCLFILMPLIESFQLERNLGPRSAMALRIIRSIRKGAGNRSDELSRRNGQVQVLLKWILETGHDADGLNDDYDEILDVAVSVLIIMYQDTSALPATLDLIFERNRKARNIHTLVWAAFKSRNPAVLKLIAQHMRSSDQRDTELVNHLLGIEASASNSTETEKRYETYIQWLNDNDPFLYFTNESLQLSSRPVFYRVDLERKYVDRGIPSYDRQPILAADDEESRYLAAFNTLSHEEKTFLSDYSHKFHQENPAEWKSWVQHPIAEQIKSAKLNRERFNDHNSWTFV